MPETLSLPRRLDSSGAPALLDMLMARRGAALRIDAHAVELAGALAMEVLIAAGRQWQADGHPLVVSAMSARFVAACEGLGLVPDAPWQTIGPAPEDAIREGQAQAGGPGPMRECGRGVVA